jgi:flavin reductase (DIM6/NTAB) family NADH-FMN oxidoreductase RutF
VTLPLARPPEPLHGLSPEEDNRAFRTALGSFATGVTIVTALDGEGTPAGITANSFASVSLDPPLILWSPKLASRRFPTFERAAHFAVHVLARDQQALCDHFVRDARFGPVPWTPGPEGLPLLDGCLARFLCRQEAVLPGGDHAIILGRVWQAARRDGAPLVFQGGKYGAFRPHNELHPGPEAEP